MSSIRSEPGRSKSWVLGLLAILLLIVGLAWWEHGHAPTLETSTTSVTLETQKGPPADELVGAPELETVRVESIHDESNQGTSLGRRLIIHCFDEGGEALPGVDLLVARPTIKNTIGDPFFLALYLERKAVALARSDRNGIAVVEGLRPGTFMAVPHQSIDRTPFYAEQLDGSPPHVEIPDHGEVHLELHLRPAGMIVGTCRSASGDLAGSVTVKSSWRGEAVPGNPYRSRQSTSDALGTYALFLRPGSYWTYPSPRRESLVYGMPQQMEVQIDLGPGEVFHKDWVFGAGEGWITGTLLDQHGEAWSGATVRVARILDVELGKPNSRSDVLARTVVQKDGGFRVGPFPDGSYEVRFGVPGHDTAGPGGLGEYPIPATALIAGAGDHSCGTSLAYRWDNVEVEVMLDLGTRVSAQTLTVTAETPGFHPDRPEIRRTQELTPDRERKYLLQYSRHKEGQVLLRVQGPGVDLEHTINIGTEPGAWFPVILAID